MSLHRLAEERSLAYHRIVAERIRKDPRLLDGVRIRLDGWIAKGGRSLPYAEEWRRLVDRPISELTDILTDPGQRARDLRQSSPFAGIVTPQERWRIWAEVREAFERKEEAHS